MNEQKVLIQEDNLSLDSLNQTENKDSSKKLKGNIYSIILCSVGILVVIVITLFVILSNPILGTWKSELILKNNETFSHTDTTLVVKRNHTFVQKSPQGNFDGTWIELEEVSSDLDNVYVFNISGTTIQGIATIDDGNLLWSIADNLTIVFQK